MVEIDECPPVPDPAAPVPAPAPPRPDPASISPDVWRRSEAAALAVARRVQPTLSSEQLRAAVIDYVQRLFGFRAGCQVFPFGSVPLKTYLPDGDIDLTAFSSASSDENLANEVHAILKSEEQRNDSQFEVKDVQYINAEVKLVKCLVQNIVVDISFNQIGGLCTLCFLEKVDLKFGKSHLFKRSIVLIKDWCYYESRILGAHHGLISTYALEILVLYIFHIFHSSLDGPLAVLYRFLDYYSKFDWDNMGISLFGPISLSSLPELVTNPPDTHDEDFLAQEEFLKECAEHFVVPPRHSESNGRVFPRKFLNIVDPLKQNNNLGRSVSKGNFYRIRSAFDFGARKLGKILQVPACSTANEVNQFFRNTLKRNHTGLRPDVLLNSSADGPMTEHVTNESVSHDLDVKRRNKDSSHLYSSSCGDLSNEFSRINISGSNNHGLVKQEERNSMAEHTDIKSVPGELLHSDGTSHATTDSVSMRNSSDFCEASPTENRSGPLPWPHLLYKSANGKKVDVRDDTNTSHLGMSTEQFIGIPHRSFDDAKYQQGLADGLATPSSGLTSENSHAGDTTNGIVSDLTGDFLTNHKNLLYAQECQQENPANQLYYQMLPPPPAQYQSMRPSNGHGSKNTYGYGGTNGAVHGPPYSPGYFVFRPFYPSEEHMAMRARGTGTYFPDPSLRKDRPPAGRGERGRNNFPPNSYQKFHHFVRPDMPADMIPLEEWQHELPVHIYVPGANDHGIPSPLNMPIPSPSPQSPSPRDPSKVPTHSPSSKVRRGNFHANGSLPQKDSKVVFGTLGSLPLEVNSKDHDTRSDSSSNSQASGPVSPMSTARNSVTGSNRMRNGQPYLLKDSGDFPPLSS